MVVSCCKLTLQGPAQTALRSLRKFKIVHFRFPTSLLFVRFTLALTL